MQFNKEKTTFGNKGAVDTVPEKEEFRKVGNWKCFVCGKYFLTKEEADEHVKNRHPQELKLRNSSKK